MKLNRKWTTTASAEQTTSGNFSLYILINIDIIKIDHYLLLTCILLQQQQLSQKKNIINITI